MHSSVSCTRSLYPWGHNVEYSINAELALGKLSEIIFFCVKKLLPLEFFSGAFLRDIKGAAPASRSTFEKTAGTIDEVLSIHGQPLVSTLKSKNENFSKELAPESDERWLSCESVFNQILPGGQLQHTCRYLRSSEWPSILSDQEVITSIARIIPFKPTLLRFGLSYFEPKRWGSLFSLAPYPMGSTIIEASTEMLTFRINFFSTKNDLRPSQTLWAAIESYASLFKEVCGIDLIQDFKAQLQTRV